MPAAATTAAAGAFFVLAEPDRDQRLRPARFWQNEARSKIARISTTLVFLLILHDRHGQRRRRPPRASAPVTSSGRDPHANGLDRAAKPVIPIRESRRRRRFRSGTRAANVAFPPGEGSRRHEERMPSSPDLQNDVDRL